MMWRNHSEEVLNSLIDNINILSEGVGDTALRLWRSFMRTCYGPRVVPEQAGHVSSELNDSIRGVFFRRGDIDITERTVSHTIDEENSSFTDDLSDLGPLT